MSQISLFPGLNRNWKPEAGFTQDIMWNTKPVIQKPSTVYRHLKSYLHFCINSEDDTWPQQSTWESADHSLEPIITQNYNSEGEIHKNFIVAINGAEPGENIYSQPLDWCSFIFL